MHIFTLETTSNPINAVAQRMLWHQSHDFRNTSRVLEIRHGKWHCLWVQLPVYTPSQAEKNDPLLYAKHVRQYMVSDILSHILFSQILLQNQKFTSKILTFDHWDMPGHTLPYGQHLYRASNSSSHGMTHSQRLKPSGIVDSSNPFFIVLVTFWSCKNTTNADERLNCTQAMSCAVLQTSSYWSTVICVKQEEIPLTLII